MCSAQATRGHVAAQFLLESADCSAQADLAGSFHNPDQRNVRDAERANEQRQSAEQKEHDIDIGLHFVAHALGLGGIGLLSGTYPALRAARLEPAEAVRH